jgi:hypothetical protein
LTTSADKPYDPKSHLRQNIQELEFHSFSSQLQNQNHRSNRRDVSPSLSLIIRDILSWLTECSLASSAEMVRIPEFATAPPEIAVTDAVTSIKLSAGTDMKATHPIRDLQHQFAGLWRINLQLYGRMINQTSEGVAPQAWISQTPETCRHWLPASRIILLVLSPGNVDP